ncbi:T9SS C-terminal target domain-containing protein [Chitinophaga silvatica]|uniref:T9SS C-terminal target domain-containing protein n=1 Tax=Chitinophaga silvatica TaxID=2282649 RepID=A0A3E1YE91_9BACT|nr:T9SS type A sorting domain-containing protein [Chitinophaga silvatica]RFS24617.1 T9SS C-terminal target domain-containing protein [Chitinophaga silvatica]
MWKTSTLLLIMVFSLTSFIGKAQSDKTQPNTDGGSKIVKLYPNPATTIINFEIQQHNNDRLYDLIVYNFLGKKIEQLKGISNRTTVSLDNYYNGLYIFQLRDQRGNLIESGKFNVIK